MNLTESCQAPVTPPSASQLDSPSQTSSFQSCVSNFFWTPQNIFGLWCKYPSEVGPTHDPEENLTLDDMADHGEPKVKANIDFGLYPNKNLYLLGNWYWSHSAQKSKEIFQELISIVGQPDFKPNDVTNMPWNKMDTELGTNHFDDNDPKWICEDTSWYRTPISTSVPFHSRTNNHGIKEFLLVISTTAP